MAMMRTRKDGGCSICYASDENVGKRRCCHVLDDASMEVRHERGINYIDLSGKCDEEEIKVSMKANQLKIKKFISSLSEGLSKKEHDDILSALRD